MMRSFLLAPCLLICLACATPFPYEKLQKDMTADGVRQTFGEPRSTARRRDARGDAASQEGKERGYSYFFYADGWNETGEFVDGLPDGGSDQSAVRRFQTGLALGGPFKRDRAFYFVSYRGGRLGFRFATYRPELRLHNRSSAGPYCRKGEKAKQPRVVSCASG